MATAFPASLYIKNFMNKEQYIQDTANTEHAVPQRACIVDQYSYQYPLSESDKWALENIRLNVDRGHTIAVFGDSASGKTTLFSSITGLNHHFYRGGKHKGEISVFGRDVATTDIFVQAKDYGVVAQDFRNQLMANRVDQAIAFPLENRAMPREDMLERVNNLVDFMHLGSVRTRDVNELSGGQGQRVAIAAMLAKEPRMMIFDDVASDLDPSGQKQVQEIIEQLKRRGITIFIADASNPKWLLESAADKALILEHGEQHYFGDPETISNNEDLSRKIGLALPSVEYREPKDTSPLITLENVSFGYSSNELAVKQVTTDIKEGSITGIIGQNGSGKTTLAKLIAGLHKPQGGSIHINGEPIMGLPAHKMVRQVAYVHQNPGETFFTDEVQKELQYTPSAIDIPQTVTADMVGLSGMENEHPIFLSAGQKQRLALGNALSADSSILILDEPTTGLNQRERLQLVEQMKQLQVQGKTILLISHDWPMIARATEDILVIDHGELVSQGPTKKVLQDKGLFDTLGLPLPW